MVHNQTKSALAVENVSKQWKFKSNNINTLGTRSNSTHSVIARDLTQYVRKTDYDRFYFPGQLWHSHMVTTDGVKPIQLYL